MKPAATPLPFERGSGLVRRALDRLEQAKRDRGQEKFEKRRQREARNLWAAMDRDRLFEPLNREERRMWEKLARRGQLNRWYARRLHQVDKGWMIPYLRELMAEGKAH